MSLREGQESLQYVICIRISGLIFEKAKLAKQRGVVFSERSSSINRIVNSHVEHSTHMGRIVDQYSVDQANKKRFVSASGQ